MSGVKKLIFIFFFCLDINALVDIYNRNIFAIIFYFIALVEFTIILLLAKTYDFSLFFIYILTYFFTLSISFLNLYQLV